MIVDLGALGVEISAQPKRMIGEPVISRVDLETVAPVAAKNFRRGAQIDQVAGVVGIKTNRRVPAERRDLVVDVLSNSSLQRQHAEVVLLSLVLADFRRRIAWHSREREDLGLIRISGDLKV